MNKLRQNPQSGFTLIEIAIVLVIIGLLLGGVMKGQSMVKNAKIKRMATDTQAVQAAINAYSDSYWVLPGDDPNSATRFAVAAVAGNGDGIILGLFEPTTPATDETALIWNHLRCAELVKGTCALAMTAALMPTSSLGGPFGIADGRDPAPLPVLGIVKKVICLGRVPVEYASIYDTQNDDGVGTTGDIRGSANAETAATVGGGTATAYVAGSGAVIHVCTGF